MSETASIHAIPNDSSLKRARDEHRGILVVRYAAERRCGYGCAALGAHLGAGACGSRNVGSGAPPDTAYARSGLRAISSKVRFGRMMRGRRHWRRALPVRVHTGRALLVVLLPYRSSPVLCTQWALMTFAQMGARLDNTTGLLQGMDDWERTLHRADMARWLIIDRVITYGVARAPADYLPQMRAFNPMARWVHDSLVNKDVLLQGLNAYHKAASLAQIALKKDDLGAWNANKVVYFSSYSAVDRAKITSLIRRWRQQYSHQIVRLWAAIRVKDVAISRYR